MRKLTTLMVMIILLAGCTKETFQEDTPTRGFPTKTEEVYNILQTHGIRMTMDEVEDAMNANRSTSQPCEWDVNMDGAIDTTDLMNMLAGYGTIYLSDDLLDMLALYGTEYIVDIVPYWQDHIQDVNCNLDWVNLPRVKCGDAFLPIPPSNLEVEWIHLDSIVGTDPFEMDWKTYGFDGDCNDEDSYQPPCNGLQEVTCRIYYDGNTYERTNVGMAHINIPDSLGIESCTGLTQETMLYGGQYYEELEFYIE